MSTARGTTFLAATALEEFWDTSMPLLYLGEWCCRFSRREYWQGLHGRLSESPWVSLEARLEAMRTCDSLYNRVIVSLGDALNELHGRNHSARYWRILLGPWLHPYIATMFDRLARVDLALKAHPNLISLGISEETSIVPAGTAEFDYLTKGDAYNLQLCTRVMRFVGIPFTTRDYPLAGVAPEAQITRRWQIHLKRIANLLLRSLGSRRAILLKSSHIPWLAELQLFARTGRSVRHVAIDPPRLNPLPINAALRGELRAWLPADTRYEQLLLETLPLDIPQAFAEGYEALGEQVHSLYGKERPKAIFTANAEYFDEAFKRFAAAAADRGTLFLGSVHGTSYGTPMWMRFEDHETSIFDRYYSWGWERSGCKAQVVPMPAGKLIGRNAIGADNTTDGILWVTTSAPRYLNEFPFPPELFSVYLDWQQRFFAAIDADIKPHVRLRPHYQDQGWDIAARLTDSFPGLSVETWKRPFFKSLRECRLYVCDHRSTTFGEALSADKPSVLFWNYEGNEVRAEAQPYFDALLRAGILYYDAAEAAACVNRVYGDVEGWWNDAARQQARRLFCSRFARTSKDAVATWSMEFRQL